MADEILPVIYVAIIAAFGYLLLIIWLYIGWRRLRPGGSGFSALETSVSIIVPARNEEAFIQQCLQGILNQDYPTALFEIIVIDDHSEDATGQIVKTIAGKYPDVMISLLTLSVTSGKKAAIQQAMQVATGSLILTTDADCLHPPTWIGSMVRCFEIGNPVFLSGPVLLRSEGGFFGVFQELEFMSLVASGAGSIGAGTPVMCNGANLGFSAAAYLQLQGDAMKNRTASGDDVFMMFAMKEKFGAGRIAFVKNSAAICGAKAAETMKGYWNQRLRWVSKSRAYRDPFLIFTALVVLLMNMGILVCAVGGLWKSDLFYISLFLLLIKMVADFPLLRSFSRFCGKPTLVWYMPLVEPLVVIYTAVTAIAGNLVNVGWKGRKVR